MSKIDQLLQKYCPEGVNKTTLGAIGVFGNIGVDKKIIDDQTRVKLLNYMDVYNNQFIDDNSITMIVSAPENKIKACSISLGDIFITPTSETRDDIGHSAVALENIEGAVYSYHIMRYRLNEFNMTLSFFINYLFRSEQIKKQIFELATGMTRYGLTKAKFESIEIPLPPLPVQEEIVRILDEFTELESELEAELESELEARTKQYEYYRNTLLNFSTGKVGFPMVDQLLQKYCPDGVTYSLLGKICEIKTGKLNANAMVNNGQYKFFTCAKEIYNIDTYAFDEEALLISGNGSQLGHIHYYKGKFNAYQRTYVLYEFSENIFYVKYVLDKLLKDRIKFESNKAGVPYIKLSTITDFLIPLPPLPVQEEIVRKLDEFSEYTTSLSKGLPAEIELRKKQYEYYRDHLLTF